MQILFFMMYNINFYWFKYIFIYNILSNTLHIINDIMELYIWFIFKYINVFIFILNKIWID
jgi:hypothetical protein